MSQTGTPSCFVFFFFWRLNAAASQLRFGLWVFFSVAQGCFDGAPASFFSRAKIASGRLVVHYRLQTRMFLSGLAGKHLAKRKMNERKLAAAFSNQMHINNWPGRGLQRLELVQPSISATASRMCLRLVAAAAVLANQLPVFLAVKKKWEVTDESRLFQTTAEDDKGSSGETDLCTFCRDRMAVVTLCCQRQRSLFRAEKMVFPSLPNCFAEEF